MSVNGESILREADFISRQMPPRATKDLTLALLEQLHQDSSPAVIVVKSERPSSPTKPNGHPQANRSPAYDPSIVYVLEIITLLAIRDESSLAAVGELVADALQNVIRNAGNTHFMVLSRAVYYLLLLLQKSAAQVRFEFHFSHAYTDVLKGSGSCPRPGRFAYDIQL